MKNWLKILIGLVIIGIIAALLVFKFVINKPHPDFDKMKPGISLKAEDLYKQYKDTKVLADSLYTGKLIEIRGVLANAELADTTVVAVFVFNQGDFGDEGIRCTFLPKYTTQAKQLAKGKGIKIKGYCTGYNDTDVIMEKCSIVE